MLHLIIGGQGSGKTAFAVQQAYIAYRKGKTVYSNVHLNFPYKKLNYDDIIHCRLSNCFVLIDEIHQLLSARRSLSKVSVAICDSFLSMIRKKKVDVYGTTQTTRKVDVRFREETDVLHKCDKYVYINKKWIKAMGENEYPKNVPVMINVTSTMISDENLNGTSIKNHMLANKVYDKYDTYQIIMIEGLKT